MKYFKLEILLVVLIILGSFPGIYANTVHDNNGMSISKTSDISTNGTKTIYVAQNGADRNDGLTPEKPKRNIEIAINAANPGDTIKLAPGTYKKNIVIDKNLTLMGDTQGNTIIDGQHIKNTICILGGVTSTITNLTITNGTEGIAGYIHISGGGISNGGTLTLENVTITNNTSEYGGGIYNIGAATIRRVIIQNNTATYAAGGGIYSSGPLTLENSTIGGNTAEWGGGISTNGRASISGVMIKNNNANELGGGIKNSGVGILTIENSTIIGNVAKGEWSEGLSRSEYGGGGIANFNVLTIKNSLIMGNGAKGDCGGIGNFDTLTIENSTVTGNVAKLVGGGIGNFRVITIYESTITNNKANNGGGIYNSDNGQSITYIDDITVLTGNTPNNWAGTPLTPA